MKNNKTYDITEKDLNLLLHYAGELFNTGTHMIYKFTKAKDGILDTDEELIVDGAHYRCDKNYQEIYRLVNRICTDKKLTGEIDE